MPPPAPAPAPGVLGVTAPPATGAPKWDFCRATATGATFAAPSSPCRMARRAESMPVPARTKASLCSSPRDLVVDASNLDLRERAKAAARLKATSAGVAHKKVQMRTTHRPMQGGTQTHTSVCTLQNTTPVGGGDGHTTHSDLVYTLATQHCSTSRTVGRVHGSHKGPCFLWGPTSVHLRQSVLAPRVQCDTEVP